MVENSTRIATTSRYASSVQQIGEQIQFRSNVSIFLNFHCIFWIPMNWCFAGKSVDPSGICFVTRWSIWNEPLKFHLIIIHDLGAIWKKASLPTNSSMIISIWLLLNSRIFLINSHARWSKDVRVINSYTLWKRTKWRMPIKLLTYYNAIRAQLLRQCTKHTPNLVGKEIKNIWNLCINILNPARVTRTIGKLPSKCFEI